MQRLRFNTAVLNQTQDFLRSISVQSSFKIFEFGTRRRLITTYGVLWNAVQQSTPNGRVFVLGRGYRRRLGPRSVEVTRRIQRAWAYFGRYEMEIYDRPSVRLRLKVRMLKAEVLETLLYGCHVESEQG